MTALASSFLLFINSLPQFLQKCRKLMAFVVYLVLQLGIYTFADIGCEGIWLTLVVKASESCLFLDRTKHTCLD